MNKRVDTSNTADQASLHDAFSALLQGNFPEQHQAHLPHFSASIDDQFDADKFAVAFICDDSIDDDLYPLPYDTIPAALKTLCQGANFINSDSYDYNGRKYALCHLTMPDYWLNDPNKAGARLINEAYRALTAMGAKSTAHMIRISLGNNVSENAHIAALLHSIDTAAIELNFPAAVDGLALKFDCPQLKIDIFAVGLYDQDTQPLTNIFADEDHHIYILGREHGHLGLSAFIHDLHGSTAGDLASIDLEREAQLSAFINAAHQKGYLTAARGISMGGIGLALADMALGANIGASVGGIGNASFWYGEDQARYVVTIETPQMAKFEVLAMDHGISLLEIGNTEEDRLSFNNQKIALDALND